MVTKVKSGVIGDNTVGITQLNVSDGSDGQVLTTNGAGTLSFSTVTGGVTGISTSADATAITIGSDESVDFAKGISDFPEVSRICPYVGRGVHVRVRLYNNLVCRLTTYDKLLQGGVSCCAQCLA